MGLPSHNRFASEISIGRFGIHVVQHNVEFVGEGLGDTAPLDGFGLGVLRGRLRLRCRLVTYRFGRCHWWQHRRGIASIWVHGSFFAGITLPGCG